MKVPDDWPDDWTGHAEQDETLRVRAEDLWIEYGDAIRDVVDIPERTVDGLVSNIMTMTHIIQFADEVSDHKIFGDPPAEYREAYQLSNGRWRVVGVDRWDYETSELIFQRTCEHAYLGVSLCSLPATHLVTNGHTNIPVCFDHIKDAKRTIKSSKTRVKTLI